MGTLLHETIEIPYLVLLLLVTFTGLMSWVIIWSRGKKLDTRERELNQSERTYDTNSTDGKEQKTG